MNQPETVNHKGTRCIYTPVLFCQEGICSRCEVYKNQELDEEEYRYESIEERDMVNNQDY